MNRRRFIAASATVGLGHLVHALQCTLIAPGVVSCRTQINFPRVQLAA